MISASYECEGQMSFSDCIPYIKRRHCGNCICRDYANGTTCEHYERYTCPKYGKGNPCNECHVHGKGDNKYFHGYDHCTFQCEHYKKSTLRMELCFGCWIQKYEDGTMYCPLVDCMGCHECMEEWEKKNEEI